MSTDLAQFHQLFFEEAAEHLEAMEQLLVALDAAAPEQDDLNAIFRAAHSIKGGSGTFGFTDLTEVTHILETLLDKIRKHELALLPRMIDVFLEAVDVLRGQLDVHRNGGSPNPHAANEVMASLKQLSDAPSAEPAIVAPAPAASPTMPPAAAATPLAYRIVYTPAIANDEIAGNLRDELARLGEATLSSGELQGDRPQYIFTVSTAAGEEVIREIVDFVALPEEVVIGPENDAPEDDGFGFFDDAPGTEGMATESVDPGYGFFTDPEPASSSEKPATDPGYGFFEPIQPQPAATAQSAAPAERAVTHAAAKPAADTSIRVSIEKVDQMINLVGELVITQAMLAQTVSHLDPALNQRLMNGMGQLERNTRDLQESVMSIRMMPISSVFNRFPRVVRDLAGKLNKEIELVTRGEGTELDKGLIERIVDPLTHLVRNSLDHGIETPEKRVAAGKDRKGTLTLSAAHRGGTIVIEVEDDGAGLDRQRILAKARDQGLAVSDSMSDQEVWQFIFAPGFSTAAAVTDVSGRGVGMDVVRRNIDALDGRIEISSALGLGTKVSVHLPLTLAILDGMSVGVGNEVFIIPLTYIAESLQPAAQDIRTVSGEGQVVHVRGEYLPLVPIYRLFNLSNKTTDPTKGILVIVETGAGRMAFFVDELLGQHQVVIKSLEANYHKVPGIAGATIMGDGRVALIFDVASVARLAQAKSTDPEQGGKA